MFPVSRGRTAYQAHVQVPEGLFEESTDGTHSPGPAPTSTGFIRPPPGKKSKVRSGRTPLTSTSPP